MIRRFLAVMKLVNWLRISAGWQNGSKFSNR